MREEFNEIQKWLVEKSERVHEAGLRHKGLSGTICEDLLMEKLRISVPEVSFARGIVKFGEPLAVGSNLPAENLSRQQDIIVFHQPAAFHLEGNVVVPVSNVVGMIEVKKWSTPKMLDRNGPVAGKLRDLKDGLLEKAGRRIPVFFVTFRFHDRREKDVTWKTESDGFVADYSYCFFGTFTHVKGTKRNLYPWEEQSWEDFKSNPYAGQYEKLVSDIRDSVSDS